MSIGSELRQAREARGISLRTLSDRTKIRQHDLHAIEGDDFPRLPGEVITRGYLKLYAREVGLDPAGVIERYLAQAESIGVGPPVPERGSVIAVPSRAPWVAAAAAALAVLTAAGYLLLRSAPGSESSAETARPPAAATASLEASPATDPTAEPRAQPPAPGAQAPAARPGGRPADAGPARSLRIALAATGPCWVSATADGRQVVFRMMEAGERVEMTVIDEAVLRIGIPANLAVSIDDQRVRTPARPGTPITLRVTPDTYRDLLER